MIQSIVIIIIGFVFQIGGIILFLKSTAIENKKVTTVYERRLYDNETGLILSIDNLGSNEKLEWMIVNRDKGFNK